MGGFEQLKILRADHGGNGLSVPLNRNPLALIDHAVQGVGERATQSRGANLGRGLVPVVVVPPYWLFMACTTHAISRTSRCAVLPDLNSPTLKTILVVMTTVSISELKANLSRYVREVRRGGEVQVLDRGTPVARLVSPAEEDDRGVRARLISQGLLRPGQAGGGAILDEPPLELPVSVSEALAEDRNDRL